MRRVGLSRIGLNLTGIILWMMHQLYMWFVWRV